MDFSECRGVSEPQIPLTAALLLSCSTLKERVDLEFPSCILSLFHVHQRKHLAETHLPFICLVYFLNFWVTEENNKPKRAG